MTLSIVPADPVSRPFPAEQVRGMHRTTVACERSTVAEAA